MTLYYRSLTDALEDAKAAHACGLSVYLVASGDARFPYSVRWLR